jgi:deoxyadenosine/deoxycytidine kinase
MAAKSRMVSEDCVLDNRLARPNRLEELPQMRPQVVVIISVIGQGLESRLFTRNRIVFLMPLRDIGTSEAARV